MEIGRIAEIDNAKQNNIEKVSKINGVEKDTKVISDDEYKKALSPKDTSELNEVILDNVKFGYNEKSKDFFVKVTRGDVNYQYPTEDMMKVKAYLLEELEALQNKN